jgi:hypothetical protein
VLFLPAEVVVLARFWRLGVVFGVGGEFVRLDLMVVADGWVFLFFSVRCCSGVVGGCSAFCAACDV